MNNAGQKTSTVPEQVRLVLFDAPFHDEDNILTLVHDLFTGLFRRKMHQFFASEAKKGHLVSEVPFEVKML
jgi:hypothetical protein